jgi:hypothetical protein
VTELLASFAAAGGAPPASHELVRVFRDGMVRALAATAWPGLGSVSEAGVYALELDAAALGGLEQLAADPGLPQALDGPLEPGSGRYVLRLGGHEPLRWSPFTTPPEPLAKLAARLVALLGEARAHPVAAVRLELDARAGDPLALKYRFTARGREPLTLTVSSLRARVVEAPSAPAEPPPLAWVREASPIEAEGGGPVELAPGETLTLEAAASAPHGRLRVDGFARVALDLAGPADAAEAHLEATLGAGPVAVEVR